MRRFLQFIRLRPSAPAAALLLAALQTAFPAQSAAQRGALRGLSVAAGAGRLETRQPGGTRDGLTVLVGFDLARNEMADVRLTGTAFDGGGGGKRAQLGGVSVDLGLTPRRATIEPYVLAGVGAYILALQRDVVGDRGNQRQYDQSSLSFNGGLGVRARFAGATAFVEGRGTWFANQNDVARAYTPIVVGLRF